MTEPKLPKVYHCPVEVTLDLIGGRWKPLILWQLNQRGVLRNGELLRLIPSITQKVLTQQLRQLEGDGLIARQQFNEIPPRVEYSLTPYGRELQGMLNLFSKWGSAHAQKMGIEIHSPKKTFADCDGVIAGEAPKILRS